MKVEDLIKIADSMEDWLIKIRRDLHETPELAMEEYITREKIKSYFEDSYGGLVYGNKRTIK